MLTFPRLGVAFACGIAILVSAAQANDSFGPVSARTTTAVERIAGAPKVKAALAAIERDDAIRLQDQIALTEIEAPPFKEARRAAEFLKRMKALGMPDAHIDAEGNVIGVRKGGGNGPRLVLSAHLDSVFPEGTDVKVKRDGAKYLAPGIYDDALGLAAVLQVLRTLNEQKIETAGDVVFVGTVGEEELGDLRGVKALFRNDKLIDGFISVDGISTWRIVNAGTGSRRFKITFRGPGGHSYGAFGLPSAIHAMGRAIAKISDVHPTDKVRTTFTVGTVSGGTSVNAIAAEAELGLDMRSEDAGELAKLEKQILGLVQHAVDEENKRWKAKAPMVISFEARLVGDRPAGSHPIQSPVVDAARAALATLGQEVKAIQASSTDSNLPISLGIPAATLGGGGNGSGSHSTREWFTPANTYHGPQHIMLAVLALAGLKDVSEPLLAKRSAGK